MTTPEETPLDVTAQEMTSYAADAVTLFHTLESDATVTDKLAAVLTFADQTTARMRRLGIIDDVENELNTMQENFLSLREKYIRTMQDLDKEQSHVKSLEAKLQQAHDDLEEERKHHEETSDEHARTQVELQALQAEYDKLRTQHDSYQVEQEKKLEDLAIKLIDAQQDAVTITPEDVPELVRTAHKRLAEALRKFSEEDDDGAFRKLHTAETTLRKITGLKLNTGDL